MLALDPFQSESVYPQILKPFYLTAMMDIDKDYQETMNQETKSRTKRKSTVQLCYMALRILTA